MQAIKVRIFHARNNYVRDGERLVLLQEAVDEWLQYDRPDELLYCFQDGSNGGVEDHITLTFVYIGQIE